MAELVYPEASYAIMGACFDVYNEKGCGFLEVVYHDCLKIELGLREIPYEHEPLLPISYKGYNIPHTYSPDFCCWGKIILELKACEMLVDEHVGQVLNYLNASGYELGLLVNFGHYPRLEYRRVAHTRYNPSSIRAGSCHSRVAR
jgi:GxxExxY protein